MTTIAKRRRPARAGSSRPESLPVKSDGSLFVAVVHASDGVRFRRRGQFALRARSSNRRLVRQWGGYLLRPDHARHLRGLLARGEWEAAIELYFGLVGKRWDKEWLVTVVTTTDGRAKLVGVLGEVVVPEALRDAHQHRDVRECEPERGIALASAL